eukprot:c9029_g1_i1.p2 GENE.c9029_g1_i1~~c9029_g1_i1.p2  ORF type:complete len:107 (-),score=13.93 c9029_g1_i1:88-408(-)
MTRACCECFLFHFFENSCLTFVSRVGEPGGFSRGRGGGGGMFSGSGVGRGNRGGSRGSGVFRGSRGGGRRGVANGGGRGRERINKTSEELNQELESFFNDPHNETE